MGQNPPQNEEMAGKVNTVSAKFSLTFGRYANGKQCFKLNDEIIAPIVVSKLYRATGKEDIVEARNDGFNIIYVPVGEVDKALFEFLDRARTLETPVMIELTDYAMGELLRRDESLNMKFSPDYPEPEEYIHYFPDYLNPKIRNWHLDRFREMAGAVSNYYNEPVVAFSIGAYDGYHIPDSERHAMFNSVKHTKPRGKQTWLPYGEYVEAGFRDYLSEKGILAKEIGFKCMSDVTPPNDSYGSRTPLHWITWIHYRRKYVMDYVRATVEAIKTVAPDMPITGTFDINFSLNDDFASPIVDIDDILDFVILYYYGIGDVAEKVTPSLLECVSQHFDSNNTPSIIMYEFSSTLGKKATTTRDYLVESLPYVSGFHFQFYNMDDANLKRYTEFVSLTKQFNLRREWHQQLQEAKLAVYISTEDIYVWDEAYHAGRILNKSDIPYDVIYSLSHAWNYPYLYIPDGQPIFETDRESRAILDDYRRKCGKIVENLEEPTLSKLKIKLNLTEE